MDLLLQLPRFYPALNCCFSLRVLFVVFYILNYLMFITLCYIFLIFNYLREQRYVCFVNYKVNKKKVFQQ